VPANQCSTPGPAAIALFGGERGHPLFLVGYGSCRRALPGTGAVESTPPCFRFGPSLTSSMGVSFRSVIIGVGVPILIGVSLVLPPSTPCHAGILVECLLLDFLCAFTYLFLCLLFFLLLSSRENFPAPLRPPIPRPPLVFFFLPSSGPLWQIFYFIWTFFSALPLRR